MPGPDPGIHVGPLTLSFRGARRREPQGAIAHRGISRFRIWCYGPTRNDRARGAPWMAGTSPDMTEQALALIALTRTIEVAATSFVADLSGALFWEEQRLLVVSDLHLEKGSSFAARGVLLPPYATMATLGRLAAVVARHEPRIVVALGDSFHDRDAHQRLSP